MFEKPTVLKENKNVRCENVKLERKESRRKVKCYHKMRTNITHQ